ncbi:hypothetical protein [Nonomuraea sp. NPDC050783]|uniref:hypothetical protein n=1 Tax=Nonomuraea sp. NPDC050783 TaxID=3154634 RepID=UPI003465C574
MSLLGSLPRSGAAPGGTARLRVEGSPGGVVYLRDGLVVAATTPASPGPESLLLRSGRVSEDAWNAAYGAGAPTGRVGAELVARAAVGSAGLEAVCLLAISDAVFALALSGGSAGPPEPLGPGELLPHLLLEPGVPPERLRGETERRLRIAAGWQEAGITARCRPVAVRPAVESPIRADALRQSVLARANGRRTPRDIAFLLGQGLFVVMQELDHLARRGLVEVDPATAPPRDDAPTLDEGVPRLPLLPRHGAPAADRPHDPEAHPQEHQRES